MSSTWINAQEHIWSWTVTPFHRFWGGGVWFESHQKWVCAVSVPVRLELNTLPFLTVSTKDLSWPILGAMQKVLLYITICQNKYYRAYSSAQICWSTIIHKSRSSYRTHIFQQLWKTIECKALRHNMWTSHILAHNTSPHIDHEMLICLAWIFLCSLTLFVEISDAISTKICLIYEEHWWDKKWTGSLLNKPSTAVFLWWLISRCHTMHTLWMVRVQWLFIEYPQDSHITNSKCCCQLSHTDT